MNYSSKHTGLSLENVIENSLLKNNNTPYTPSGDYDPTTKKYVEEYVTNMLQSYVQKVSGKGLSTNDFTNDLMNKLNGLENYDDTTIKNSVQSLQNSLNTLTHGDATSAIESFNEIIAFLEGIEDSQSLDSIIASIEQQIADKQEKLVSGTNIKTINGTSILGSGNIVIEGGGGITAETDPIFSASAAAMITEEKITEWDNKGTIIAEDTRESADDVVINYATIQYVDDAISRAITVALNTEV